MKVFHNICQLWRYLFPRKCEYCNGRGDMSAVGSFGFVCVNCPKCRGRGHEEREWPWPREDD